MTTKKEIKELKRLAYYMDFLIYDLEKDDSLRNKKYSYIFDKLPILIEFVAKYHPNEEDQKRLGL